MPQVSGFLTTQPIVPEPLDKLICYLLPCGYIIYHGRTMSHFVLLTIIDPADVLPREIGTGSDVATASALTLDTIKEHKTSILSHVDEVLHPFDENMEVDEYTRDCYCVGWQARNDAGKVGVEAAVKMFNMTVDDLRDQLNRRMKEESLDPESEEYWTRRQELWKGLTFEYFAFQDKAHERALAEHPENGKPDPTCEDCSGTGREVSCYNPNSKWDWYQVGGRWEGWLADIDPAKDPRNTETCWVCKGTGKRDDEIGREARAKNPKYTCNGCKGEGTSLKWPTQWADSGGNIGTTDLAAAAGKAPFAFLTPEGEWIERGSMGWWGVVSDGKEQADWEAQVQTIYARYPQHIVVTVDCHI